MFLVKHKQKGRPRDARQVRVFNWFTYTGLITRLNQQIASILATYRFKKEGPIPNRLFGLVDDYFKK